mgnify:CR=1 FL=1
MNPENPLTVPATAPITVPIAIIGGGPAGLMAAQVLSDAGLAVHLFDAMPSIGRKFLLAGKGGLNPFRRRRHLCRALWRTPCRH